MLEVIHAMKFPDELVALKAPLPGLEIQLQMMNDSMGKIRKEASLQMNEGAKKAAVFSSSLSKNGSVVYGADAAT